MLQLVFLLSLNKINVQVNGPYGVHSSLKFGFAKNGHYYLNLSRPSAPMVFGLASKSEIRDNSILNFDYSPRPNFCLGRNPLAQIQQFVNTNETATLSGIIPKKGVYTPFYYACDNKYTFTVLADFMNGNSHLDNRMYPATIYTPIFIGLFGILFILWLVNWFTHFTLEIKIHYFLTTCFTFAVIMRGLYYGYLLDLKKTGFISNGIYYSYYIIDGVNTLFLLITLIFAARGWYIITKKIDFKKLILPLIFSLLFVVFNLLLTFLSLGFYDFVIALVALICLGVYVFYLTRFINESLFKITAHILVIKNEGIDPKSTPVYQKYKMFKLYFKALIVYCVCVIIQLIVECFADDITWLNHLLSDISAIILACFLFYIFMLRQKRYNGYLIIEEGDVEECSQNDIQNFQNEGVEGAEGVEWDINSPLPPAPVIIGYGSGSIPQNKEATAANNEYSLDNLDNNHQEQPAAEPKDNKEEPKNPYENPITVQQT